MKTTLLTNIILDSKPFYSDEWLKRHAVLFQKDYIEMLSKRLISFFKDGIPIDLELPHFDEEIIPELQESFLFFKDTLVLFEAQHYVSNKLTQRTIAKVIGTINFKHVLLIMGQRVTSATIQDINGLPLAKNDLIKSCFKPYNSQISNIVRAWEKHVDRSGDDFWGQIQGNPKAKEEKAKTLVNTLIDKQTWWNVFYHYKHELVYEIRVSSGHGMRWRIKDHKLIGFLEPFL